VAPDNRPAGSPLVFGPTDWRQKPHTCPPGAVEAWAERLFRPGTMHFLETSG
jgi:hypothetical protein